MKNNNNIYKGKKHRTSRKDKIEEQAGKSLNTFPFHIVSTNLKRFDKKFNKFLKTYRDDIIFTNILNIGFVLTIAYIYKTDIYFTLATLCLFGSVFLLFMKGGEKR